jgi:shikimate dehydrogenase
MVFNHIFADMGLDMVYISHDIAPKAVPATIRSFSGWHNLGGFNVTIPHKEAVAARLKSLCEVSSRTGAVNTVVRHEDGSMSGYNTDGFGAVRALGDVSGETCLMIGAGGAARSIVDALLEAGADKVLVLNRSLAPARRLCGLFPGKKVEIYKSEPLHDFSIVVQATPVAQEIPAGLEVNQFRKGTRILETVMRYTALSEKATGLGLELIPGHRMLYHQTRRNFKLFTGIDLPEKQLDEAFASVGYAR